MIIGNFPFPVCLKRQTEQWSNYFDDGEDDNELQDAYKYYFPEQFEGDFEYVSLGILYFQFGAECHLKSFKSQDVHNYSSWQFFYIPF